MFAFGVEVFGEIADFLLDLWVNKVIARFQSRGKRNCQKNEGTNAERP